MITIKSRAELDKMRIANRVVGECLKLIEQSVVPGVTTKELDIIAKKYIDSCGCKPSFLGYGGFPATICASINEEVVHGIPSKRILVEGDIISIDCGAIYQGYHGDAARTFGVGRISEKKQKLIEVTQHSFFEAIKTIRDGARLGDIGWAVQNFVEKNGYSVVRALVGHGIGQEMHEDPQVPNYGIAGRGIRLKSGMTLAVEPMINIGTYEVIQLEDGWTVVTKDGQPSAHYENTVVVLDDGVEILSL